MSKKLISMTLVLTIILTTAVATYAMEQITETPDLSRSGFPDGIGYTVPSELLSGSDQGTSTSQGNSTSSENNFDDYSYIVPDGIGYIPPNSWISSDYTVVNAGEEVDVTYLNREIIVNGEFIANYQSNYPYFSYNQIVYIPITWENCNILGYRQDHDANYNLTLTRTAPTQKNYTDQSVKCTEITQSAIVSGKKVIVRNPVDDIDGFQETLLTTEVTQGYPILEYKDVIYIPLTYNVANHVLKWDKEYNDFTGLYLDTVAPKTNEKLINDQTLAYNKALVNYIREINPNVPEVEAIELVFLVKQKARIYGVDERLVLAMIHKESSFYDHVTGSGGSIGLMQIMPATARAHGVPSEELWDPENNIDFGTMYISSQIEEFGDLSSALVAYNAGGSVVRGGKTTSVYSQMVLSYYQNLLDATGV